MSSIVIAALVFGCTLVGALAGTWLSTRLPADHTDTATKDTVKLVMGLVATMSALVPGLLISVSWPFLVVLVFWLVALFIGFGLFARFNGTVVATFALGAISVAGAIFLILEMNRPYSGLMQISSAPIRNALTQIPR